MAEILVTILTVLYCLRISNSDLSPRLIIRQLHLSTLFILCLILLCCAVLCCAVLCCAVLCCAVLCCNTIFCVVLGCATSCYSLQCYCTLCALWCIVLFDHSTQTPSSPLFLFPLQFTSNFLPFFSSTILPSLFIPSLAAYYSDFTINNYSPDSSIKMKMAV
jgi:hypothetical protein